MCYIIQNGETDDEQENGTEEMRDVRAEKIQMR
jgi:hypothetical protein